MKIIICGANQIGLALVKYLRPEDHDIVLIDPQEGKLGQLSEQYDIQTIAGNPSHPDVLEKAEASRADVILAVFEEDHQNILTCALAQHLFAVPKRIARIENMAYLTPEAQDFLKSLSVDVVVSPEFETVQRIIQTLPIPAALDMVELADGLAVFLGVRCRKSSLLVGKNMKEVRSFLTDIPAVLAGVNRRSEWLALNDKRAIRSGDELYFVADKDYLTALLDVLGSEKLDLDNLIIFGGGTVGFHLAWMLEKKSSVATLTLVEKTEKRSQNLAAKLNKTLVIHGDGLDESLLDELDLKKYRFSVATTINDESNILLSLVAKRNGVSRTCALSQNPLFAESLGGLGADNLIDPSAVIVSSILQQIRKGRVKADYFLQSGRGEILEIEAQKKSKIIGKTVAQVNKKTGICVGGIKRGDTFLSAKDDLIVKERDVVVLCVQQGFIKQVESLFSVDNLFF